MPYREDGFYEQGGGWVAGVDFDPSDPDEMEMMHAVWDHEKHDKIRNLEDENERLRRALNEKNGVDD